MKPVETKFAPPAIGPYSQAMIAGDLVFTSAQLAMDPKDPDSGLVPGGISRQAERVLENLKQVLEAAGSGLNHVVKTTCYLASMADFAAFNAIYIKFFPHKPARACITAKQLPRDALLMVEAIAEVVRKQG